MQARPMRRVLITGGSGFLGRALLRELRPSLDDPGIALREIRLFDLEPDHALAQPGVVLLAGDVRDAASLESAFDEVDVVIHSASVVDWGHVAPETVREVNVEGTERVIAACCASGVPALVYTSSMDVVCGRQPVVDVDESCPFPDSFLNLYCETKARAENLALEANGRARSRRLVDEAQTDEQPTLLSCAIRPVGMFGEGDPYHVPNVVRVVRAGGLPFRPGNGRARFQHVYVGNVAHAHLLAATRLLARDERIAGSAYFIVDDSPVENFLVFMEPILEAVGYTLPPRDRTIPYPVMLAIGGLMEAVAAVVRPVYKMTPVLTRSSVRFVCQDHTFDGDRARQELGYKPIYSYPEALGRTIDWLRDWLREEETRSR